MAKKFDTRAWAALIFSIIIASAIGAVANRQWDLFGEVKHVEAEIKYHEHDTGAEQ